MAALAMNLQRFPAELFDQVVTELLALIGPQKLSRLRIINSEWTSL
jgi:hypothetical protein